jgi:hypothetical protein
MRTTLTLEEDVAQLLARVQKEKKASLKQVINQALRQGLQEMLTSGPPRKKFETRSVSLGKCLIGSIDDVAETLAVAEGESFR